MYDPKSVSNYYNELSHGEWERLDQSAHSRLVYQLHLDFLQPHLGDGFAILDAGSGAGKFSVHIAQTDCQLTILDISPEQLSIAKQKIDEAKLGDSVSNYIEANIADLSQIPDNTFETTLCYGGALNYLFDNVDQGIRELKRVTKPGGTLLASVMSRLGVLRFVMANKHVDPKDFFGRADYWHINQVLETGDLPKHEDLAHPARHFFTSAELEELFKDAGLEQIQMGCTPAVFSALRDKLDEAEKDPAAWETILNMEKAAYQLPGILDSGEFLLIKGQVPLS